MGQKAKFELYSKDHRAGTYEVHDVSDDPTWHDVKAVESHWDSTGRFTGTINHRELDFKMACDRLIANGASLVKQVA